MASNQLFLAVCGCLLGYAALVAAQGFPTAAEQAAKDVLKYPLSAIMLRVYKKDVSYKEFSVTTADAIVPFLNSTQKTVLLVHGYLQSTDDPFIYNMIKGFVKGYKFNVVAMDYRFVSYNFYTNSVLLADVVAGVLSNGLRLLVKAGYDQDKLVLCGFSLGAQIVGTVGRHAHKKFKKIIGLDPAGPMYNMMETSISSSDAECVICVHTDAGYYGTSHECGHIDFYPNKGTRNQPGCSLLTSLGACSHESATKLSAEAATNPHGFPSIKCGSWLDFKEGNCNSSAIIPFGANAPCSASGKFYLQTNPQQPYARHMDGVTYDSSLDNNFFE